ncbi:MAG TPA: hypothetical protein VFU32_09250 [Ktedonobacterales bacterium]|nr:hypothetical protein [Ktedonobacterales bacterium]
MCRGYPHPCGGRGAPAGCRPGGDEARPHAEASGCRELPQHLAADGLALVGITALICLGVGWSQGYRYGHQQAEQARRARRRKMAAGPSRKRG